MVRVSKMNETEPRIIPETEHGIMRSQFSASALSVIRTLNEAGFTASLVGGCIRDLLLGKTPKDYDVVTNATPEQTKKLFRRAYVIGRRFRLVQVIIGRQMIEVSTYRTAQSEIDTSHAQRRSLRRKKSAVASHFGQSQREDAMRRDFTLNSLYLDPTRMVIIDHTGGFEDIQAGIVRAIGDPRQRYRNDPLRMLRAIRFAANLDFEIEEQTAAAIGDSSELMGAISHARLTDELPKMFLNNHAVATFELLFHFSLFQQMFPAYSTSKGICIDEKTLKWIFQLMRETDARKPNGETLSLVYFFAALLWLPFNQTCKDMRTRSGRGRLDKTRIASRLIALQSEVTYISARHEERIVSIWQLQSELERSDASSAVSIAKNFRPALRLLELRARTGEISLKVTKKWTSIRDQQKKKSRPRDSHRRSRRRNPRWA